MTINNERRKLTHNPIEMIRISDLVDISGNTAVRAMNKLPMKRMPDESEARIRTGVSSLGK